MQYERLNIATSDILKIDPTQRKSSLTTCLDYNRDIIYLCPTTFQETEFGTELMKDFLSIFIPPNQSIDQSRSISQTHGMNIPRLQHVALDVMNLRAIDLNYGIRKHKFLGFLSLLFLCAMLEMSSKLQILPSFTFRRLSS